MRAPAARRLSEVAGTLVRVPALDRFSAPTRAWFTGAFELPGADVLPRLRDLAD